MPELFNVLAPQDALKVMRQHVRPVMGTESVATEEALDRVLAEDLTAPEDLPTFARSSMDGYSVRARDTFGASESLPAFMTVVGEVPMGRAPEVRVAQGQAVVAFTGGMLADGADAVVIVEQTQQVGDESIEVFRAVAPGENVIQVGEDVRTGDPLLSKGQRIRPQDIGGLTAMGITTVRAARQPRVAILATGDEVIPPGATPEPGQIRDINSYTVAALVRRGGGLPSLCGIIPDRFEALLDAARSALDGADMLILSAGFVSIRDMTANVINELGAPGVLVHGVSLRPGKPTVLAMVGDKPVIGLPGNPVSAMIVFDLFVTPILSWICGADAVGLERSVPARLTHNIASAPGREDYVPVRLVDTEGGRAAEPLFGKSNLIYTLVRADGIVQVPLDTGGLYAGDAVDVRLF